MPKRHGFSLAETVVFPQAAARWWCCPGCISVNEWTRLGTVHENPLNTHNKRIWSWVGDKRKIYRFNTLQVKSQGVQGVGAGKAREEQE